MFKNRMVFPRRNEKKASVKHLLMRKKREACIIRNVEKERLALPFPLSLFSLFCTCHVKKKMKRIN